MLRSMTGFGSAQAEIEGVNFTVEIRSVNNRYFKPVIKLPEIWANAESDIEKLLRAKLSRGSVVLSLRARIPDDQAAYRVNTAALANYLDQLRPVEIEANPMLRIDLGALLQLPGVCEPPELGNLCERTFAGILALVAKAIDQLIQMRHGEGQLLKADLLNQCEVLESDLAKVSARSPMVVKEYHQRLLSRVAELTSGGTFTIEHDALAREVAIYAERCDIAEEIARLSGHILHFRQAMVNPEPSGRKLDFLAQEMLREVNTIGSKANDAEIAMCVVDMKTAVDRIKEQVQNAE